MLCPHKMLNKCKVCIKSDFWKIKRKSKRISQTFNFSVSNMELRSGLYQFIKENDYEPEPYTLKSDIDSFPGSIEYSNLKMIGKNKPILLVDVRSLFFQEEYDYHIFHFDLWNFDEKISEYFEPKYIWSGDEITLSQRRMSCRIHYHLFNTSDFFNPVETFKEIVLQLNGVHEIMVLYGQGVLGDLYKNYLLNKDFDEKESTNG